MCRIAVIPLAPPYEYQLRTCFFTSYSGLLKQRADPCCQQCSERHCYDPYDLFFPVESKIMVSGQPSVSGKKSISFFHGRKYAADHIIRKSRTHIISVRTIVTRIRRNPPFLSLICPADHSSHSLQSICIHPADDFLFRFRYIFQIFFPVPAEGSVHQSDQGNHPV